MTLQAHIDKYLELITNEFHNFGDCRKALLLHRFYLVLEISFDNFLKSNSLKKYGDPSRYHKEIVNNICYLLDLDQHLSSTLDELRKFRHMFANNYTIICFEEKKLNTIRNKIMYNQDKLYVLVKEVAHE